MKNSQLLRSKGFPIQVDEDKLRLQLEKAEMELQRSAQFNENLNHLWNQVQGVRDNQRDTVLTEKWALTSEKDVHAISEVSSTLFLLLRFNAGLLISFHSFPDIE